MLTNRLKKDAELFICLRLLSICSNALCYPEEETTSACNDKKNSSVFPAINRSSTTIRASQHPSNLGLNFVHRSSFVDCSCSRIRLLLPVYDACLGSPHPVYFYNTLLGK